MASKKPKRRTDKTVPQKQQEGDKKGTSVGKGNSSTAQTSSQGAFFFQFDNDRPEYIKGQKEGQNLSIRVLPSIDGGFKAQCNDKTFELYYDALIGFYCFRFNRRFTTIFPLISHAPVDLLISLTRVSSSIAVFNDFVGHSFKIFYKEHA